MSPAPTHYENAFEGYLQQYRLPYVAVDQAKKAVFADVQLKSFDFIVYPRQNPALLIDVKGRKFPRNQFDKGLWGQNWVTNHDIEGLARWQNIFGKDYRALFVFAYWLCDNIQAPPHTPPTGPNPLNPPNRPTPPPKTNHLFETIYNHNHRDYFFAAAQLDAYRNRMKPRSAKWNTVYVPARHFRQLVRPFGQVARPPHSNTP